MHEEMLEIIFAALDYYQGEIDEDKIILARKWLESYDFEVEDDGLDPQERAEAMEAFAKSDFEAVQGIEDTTEEVIAALADSRELRRLQRAKIGA